MFAATKARMEKSGALKEAGNKKLQEISAKYAGLMREIRLEKAARAKAAAAAAAESKAA